MLENLINTEIRIALLGTKQEKLKSMKFCEQLHNLNKGKKEQFVSNKAKAIF